MFTSARDVCQNILDQLRLSQLHSKLTETPYSAEVVVRKRFIKDSEGPHQSFLMPSNSAQIHDVKSRNEILEQENLSLLDFIKDREDTIKLLEEKLEINEANTLKNFKNANEEVKTLKTVIKNHNNEISNMKSVFFVKK